MKFGRLYLLPHRWNISANSPIAPRTGGIHWNLPLLVNATARSRAEQGGSFPPCTTCLYRPKVFPPVGTLCSLQVDFPVNFTHFLIQNQITADWNHFWYLASIVRYENKQQASKKWGYLQKIKQHSRLSWKKTLLIRQRVISKRLRNGLDFWVPWESRVRKKIIDHHIGHRKLISYFTTNNKLVT